PRPRNSWVIYRSKQSPELRKLPQYRRMRESDLSKVISVMWKALPPDERLQYDRDAQREKLAHQEMYPGYQFRPMSRVER
ncbi:hypothetical protein PLICRDRAFT_82773, partial [Plicaturopsis crispa FD-325 SS-3]